MKKRVVSLLLAGAMAMGLLSGCGSDASNSSTNSKQDSAGGEKQEIVDINFYFPGSAPNDQERVMEKANAIIEKEIGVHLNLIPLADYTTMQLMIDTGDEWDMCFSSNWLGDYYGNAQDGAYADLTELLPELAPKTYSKVPESLWEGMKVKGKIYGMVNYQLYGSSKKVGLRFRTDIADEVGFDWKSVKGMDILEALKKVGDEFLAPAMKAHPDMIGWEAQAGSNLYTQQAGLFFNCEAVGDTTTVGWISFDDPTKVFNQYASDDFMEYCKLMREWYEKGYIPADAATVTDTSVDRQNGKYLFEVALGWPDSIDFPREEPLAMSMCTSDTAPAGEVSISDLVMPSGAGPTAAVSVSADSPNIEKCVELMELLNTNDELFKLIIFGEEDVDYSWDENGKTVFTDGGYTLANSEFYIAQSYDDEGFDRMVMDKTDAAKVTQESYKVAYEGDKEAPASPLSGFVFDNSNVQTEIANVTSIISEMLVPLVSGSVDPEKTIPEFLSRLDQAGAQKIIDEKQAQLDAWNASK